MAKYRKKPLIVDAVQFFSTLIYTGEEANIIFDAVKKDKETGDPVIETLKPVIETPKGIRIVNEGDWIIKDDKGEFSLDKDRIFKETYEFVSD